MAVDSNVLLYTTIGDVIRKHRIQANISLSQLAKLSGLSKSVISKLEGGDTRHPELRTVRAIAEVLDIPYEMIVEHYIQVEQRVEALFDLVVEAIGFCNTSLVSKVALKFLESPHAYTDIALERLFTLAGTVTNTEIKLLLYKIIVKYAREHGIPKYIAKGLLQKYLIDRCDLKRLEESFQVGKEILHYTDFLAHEEKIILYYRMALHAHNIKKYDECIEFGKLGHAEDITSNELKERVALAICNSYSFLGKYETLEEHLALYEKLKYSFIIERIKYFRAIILSRTGNYHEAIPLLRECLTEITDSNRLHRVNMLLEALFIINDLDSIRKILDSEENKILVQYNDPYQFAELGRYYRYKGTFLVKSGCFNEGMAAFLNSILHYGKISDHKNITQCTDDIYTYHCLFEKTINLELLRKFKEVYNTLIKEQSEG
ncbi:helix-turn-helix domain-containing protein [Brevibacillus sp. SYSU BS000544]|uniref:helix-turn-helix domain-containing protein n=1 Tax=Brevibacillus sp. SYSU BS000544 TaxID=3416443 RepID=UPI003CE4F887